MLMVSARTDMDYRINNSRELIEFKHKHQTLIGRLVSALVHIVILPDLVSRGRTDSRHSNFPSAAANHSGAPFLQRSRNCDLVLGAMGQQSFRPSLVFP